MIYKDNNIIKTYLGDGDVKKLYYHDNVSYHKVTNGDTPHPHDYSKDYFTIVALGDNLVLSWEGKVSGNCLSYSTDSGATWSEPADGFEVTLANSGDTIMFKGSGMTTSLNNPIGSLKSNFKVDYKVQGNIMSLLFDDNFVNQTDLTGYVSAFWYFFQGPTKVSPNAHLLSVENLVLPATTLAQNCYQSMFNYCTSITTAPILPATTLSNDCYNNMFKGCASLTTAPELPATTLANKCYYNMFSGCTSLTTASVLPATTLATNCYYGMFQGCSNLTEAPELPATTLANYCYQYMFKKCTSLTTAPDLSATTLSVACYYDMFNGCTSLSAITCLATDISAISCTYQWMTGVAANGTFTKAASMSSWTTGDSGIPSGWTVVDYSG